jgi:hypothetical protein
MIKKSKETEKLDVYCNIETIILETIARNMLTMIAINQDSVNVLMTELAEIKDLPMIIQFPTQKHITEKSIIFDVIKNANKLNQVGMPILLINVMYRVKDGWKPERIDFDGEGGDVIRTHPLSKLTRYHAYIFKKVLHIKKLD